MSSWQQQWGDLPEAEETWAAVTNLDVFFTKVYLYYSEKGFWSVILTRITNLLTLAFTVLFSTFLLLCVDWDALVECTSMNTQCHDVIGLQSRTLEAPTFFELIIMVYFLVFTVYWLFTFVSFYYSLRDALEMREFFNERLRVSDDHLATMEWYVIVDKLVELQKTHKYSIVKDLDALDVTNRIMRKENYMISLVNGDLVSYSLPLSLSAWFGSSDDDATTNTAHSADIITTDAELTELKGFEYTDLTEDTREVLQEAASLKQQQQLEDFAARQPEDFNTPANINPVKTKLVFGQSLDWNVKFCILGAMFDSQFQLREVMREGSGAAELKKRFFYMGVLNLVLLPFLVIFQIIFFALKNAENLHSKKENNNGPREWTVFARWRLREYNELPHLFVHRLNGSYAAANKYLEQFPNTLLVILAQCTAYVSGAIVGIIALITLSDSLLLTNVEVFGQSLLWHLACFSVVLTVSRSFIPERTFVFQPAQLMKEVIKYTHYLPTSWRGRTHTYDVQSQFSALFKSRVGVFFDEIFCVILTPFLLMFLFPTRAERIIEHILNNTARIDGMGDLCAAATLQVDKYGNHLYNAEKEARNDDGSVLQSTSDVEVTIVPNSPLNQRQISAESKVKIGDYVPPHEYNSSNSVADHTTHSTVPTTTTTTARRRKDRTLDTQGKLEKSLLTFVVNNPNYNLQNIPKAAQFVEGIMQQSLHPAASQMMGGHNSQYLPSSPATTAAPLTPHPYENSPLASATTGPALHTDEFDGMMSFSDETKGDLMNISYATLMQTSQQIGVSGLLDLSVLAGSSSGLDQTGVRRSLLLDQSQTGGKGNMYGDASISNLFSMLEKGYEAQVIRTMKQRRSKPPQKPQIVRQPTARESMGF